MTHGVLTLVRADLCDAISNATLHATEKQTIVGSLEASVTLAARVLVDHYDVTCDNGDDQCDFGGLCVNFRAALPGQALP